MLRTFKELSAWQRAYELAKAVYATTRGFPADERFGLTAQLQRAAVSVPSNIAEGYGRGTTADYVRFLWMANASLCEIETQLLLARDLKYATGAKLEAAFALLFEVGRVLPALIRSLGQKVK